MNAQQELLQLKHLSHSGEVVNCINSPAGKVTVLRGFQASDLEPFQRALSGVPGPERVLIQVNGQEFVPEQHILVGFGEDAISLELTGLEYLSQFMNSSAAEPLLFSYGLESTKKKTFSVLSSDERRRLILLGATYQPDKALVLQNPFEPMASKYREKFAELVLGHAKNNNAIVLVSSLQHRPECWLENENISRIQLGENVQKTIGFAGGSSGVQELIKDVRASIKKGEKLGDAIDKVSERQREESGRQRSSNADSRTVGKKKRSKKRKPKPPIDPTTFTRWLIPVAAVMLLVLFSLTYFASGPKEPTKIAKIPVKATTEKNKTRTTPTTKAPVKTVSAEQMRRAITKKTAATSGGAKGGSNYIFDSYPPEVKRALVMAIEQGNPPYAKQVASVKSSGSSTSEEREAAGLLNALQSLSGSGDHLPDAPKVTSTSSSSGSSVSSLNSADREKRRELIRQKFLEAIQKASAK